MNRRRWIPRYSLLASLCLALTLLSAPVSAEVPLRAYTASYDLYRSGMNFATAELSLAPVEQYWRWRLSTRTRGVYKMFYDKKPYTETTFILDQDSMRLHKIELSNEDRIDKDDYEAADFDWQAGQMKVLRKGTEREARLSADVFDYQTIHLLAARMQLQGLKNVTVGFYRKGKVVESKLTYQGDEAVEFGGEKIDARVYRQTVTGSRTVSLYFYDARNPLVPLLVETQKDDDSPTTLRLRKVEWHS